MPYSTCCNSHTNFPEIDLCPECQEHCDWEDYIDPSDEQLFNNANTEGCISTKNDIWQGR